MLVQHTEIYKNIHTDIQKNRYISLTPHASRYFDCVQSKLSYLNSLVVDLKTANCCSALWHRNTTRDHSRLLAHCLRRFSPFVVCLTRGSGAAILRRGSGGLLKGFLRRGWGKSWRWPQGQLVRRDDVLRAWVFPIFWLHLLFKKKNWKIKPWIQTRQ